MPETTPNLALDKAILDEENWGPGYRSNLDLLDHVLGETIAGGADPNPSGVAIKGHKNQLLLDANNVVWLCVTTDLAEPPTTPAMWVKLGTVIATDVVAQRNIWGAGQAQEWESVAPIGGVLTLNMNMAYIEFTASVDIQIDPPVSGTGDGEYNGATMQDQGQIIVARVNHPGTNTITLNPGISYLGGAAALPVSPAGSVSIYTFFKQPGGNIWYATALLGYN